MRTYHGWQAIADRLNVSPRTARRWERRYGLPVDRNGGVHITESSLSRWPVERVEHGDPLPPRVWIAAVRPTLVLACDFAEVRGRQDIAVQIQRALESVPDA